VGAHSAVSHVLLAHGKRVTANLRRVNQIVRTARKGRSSQTRRIFLINAEDVEFVMQSKAWKWRETVPRPRIPSADVNQTFFVTSLNANIVPHAPGVNMESLRIAHQPATPNVEKVIISFYDYILLSLIPTVKYEEKPMSFDSLRVLCLILKIAYFHIECSMFLPTGSSSKFLWFCVLIPILMSALICWCKFFLCSNHC